MGLGAEEHRRNLLASQRRALHGLGAQLRQEPLRISHRDIALHLRAQIPILNGGHCL
jgi:hypothetical protein